MPFRAIHGRGRREERKRQERGGEVGEGRAREGERKRLMLSNQLGLLNVCLLNLLISSL